MPRLRIARLRSAVLIVTVGFAPSMALTGCGSGGGGNPAPVASAEAGQAAAKSSMEYMKQRHADSKGASKTKSSQASRAH
jgi:hypothetical protein